MNDGNMQEIIVNALFIAVLVVIAFTLGRDVLKKRKRMKIAQSEEEELTASLQDDLPEGYVMLKDLFLNTLLGPSRADYVIVSPYGIFALEYRQLYVYIRADTERSRWTYAPGIKGKPFTSPLYQSMVHLHSIKELIEAKPNLHCYPMIAFPTVAEIELKNPMDDAFVGLAPAAIAFIEEWQEEECLTSEEVSAIVELLKLNSEKVKEMEKPEATKETPEEYKVFIPGDFREDEDEDDEEDDEDFEDEEEASEEIEAREAALDEAQDFTDASDEEIAETEEDFGVAEEGPKPILSDEPSEEQAGESDASEEDETNKEA